ncbi:RNA polymerase subunit sigma [Paenibacillus sp. KS1]|uniref:RNA polymerase sigma factor n=1 Tax=unclassified Paenibacillus TaxID=185978 RepID=UPI0008065094|nr:MULTISPECIES: RNA polymerase sigma factor [unclassified Paenibacillus]OBY80265.1 RNA polymerase subunit sigma [Paenibacillus sp. KS1]GAV13632.1 RNA polymerase sigma factor [Paenibacillus sp. NAIST15-1]
MELSSPGERQQKQQFIEAIVAKVQEGDDEAFAILIHHFERQMYSYCYYLLTNREEAEDALQEIFLQAYRNLNQYIQNTNFSAWLYKIAYNHSMNVLKKRKRWYRLLLRSREIAPNPVPINHAAIIENMLELLTVEERHILLLRAVEQYSFTDIADIMGSNPAAIRKKYERLRTKLRNNDKEVFANGEMVQPN